MCVCVCLSSHLLHIEDQHPHSTSSEAIFLGPSNWLRHGFQVEVRIGLRLGFVLEFKLGKGSGDYVLCVLIKKCEDEHLLSFNP